MDKVFVGIDPGKEGFIAIYDESVGKHEFMYMPEKREGTGKYNKNGSEQTKLVFDPDGFRDLILSLNDKMRGKKIFAVIEEVIGRGDWSAQNTFNFGYVAGLQRMILVMLGATYMMVRPQKWQSVMYKGVEKVYSPSKSGSKMVHDTKATSEKVAKSLFPNYDFRRTLKSKNTDDNKTDALLMCEYGRLHIFKDA